MSGIKDDEVVQTLPADRGDQPFGVWILPRVAGRCEDFFDLERSDTRPNVVAINAVPIPQQIARSFVFGEGLDNLLEVQAGVEWSVTLKCSTSRRLCSNTMNTNRTLRVIVGTVKRSIETI